MQPLIKNTSPELIDTIKIQNGFLGCQNYNGKHSNIQTIMPDRIMAIYKNYIAVNNFDKLYAFNNYPTLQTDVLLFEVFKIENPGNVFARFISNYSYNLSEYVYLITPQGSYNPLQEEDCFNRGLDLLEITILVNRILESGQIQYVSSSDLFPINQLSQFLSKEKIQELQNSNNQFLLSHTKPFESFKTDLDSSAKKVIAEYIDKNKINIPMKSTKNSIMPNNISYIQEEDK